MGKDFKNVGIRFWHPLEKVVGDGSDTLFWLDKWFGNLRLERDNEVLVKNRVLWTSRSWSGTWGVVSGASRENCGGF